MKRALVLAFLALATIGCLDVARERSERDLEVGRREADGLRIQVRDGLAAVRRLDHDTLELWANAPQIHATLIFSETTAEVFRIRVRNVLPDAELNLRLADGRAATQSSVNTTVVTERRVELRPGSDRVFLLEVAAPDQGTLAPFEFLAFADVQDAIEDVGEIFARMNRQEFARFVMLTGDISERGRREELERFQVEQRALRIPIFVTLGNHELGTSTLPYYDYFGRGSQSFSFRGVRFTTLDSASATLDPVVYEWLDGWLAQGRDQAHFVFMHVPPIDPIGTRNGCFSSRAESNKLVGRLARAGISAAIYGHVHSYYSFEHAGIPAFISGGGGAIPERFDGIGRHFLAVQVDPRSRTFRSRIVRVD